MGFLPDDTKNKLLSQLCLVYNCLSKYPKAQANAIKSPLEKATKKPQNFHILKQELVMFISGF